MKEIHILFVDDEELILSALKRHLRKEPYRFYYAEKAATALEIMADIPIHILVTDMKMPEMDGLTLLQQVKQMYPDTVRIALSAYTMTGQLLPCINTGEIFRFITKPILPKELRQAIGDAVDYYLLRKDRLDLINELKGKNEKLEVALEYQRQMEKRLQKLAVTDELTGLFNRRSLNLSLDNEFKQCLRYDMDLSCLILDLDHFKQVNDTCGHGFGDFVLEAFSARLKNAIRGADSAFRWGGEEFAILLPHTGLEKALITGDRILKACREKRFEEGGQSVAVTVSIGAACFKHHRPQTANEMLKIADRMLYTAKNNGRNQIHF